MIFAIVQCAGFGLGFEFATIGLPILKRRSMDTEKQEDSFSVLFGRTRKNRAEALELWREARSVFRSANAGDSSFKFERTPLPTRRSGRI